MFSLCTCSQGETMAIQTVTRDVSGPPAVMPILVRRRDAILIGLSQQPTVPQSSSPTSSLATRDVRPMLRPGVAVRYLPAILRAPLPYVAPSAMASPVPSPVPAQPPSEAVPRESLQSQGDAPEDVTWFSAAWLDAVRASSEVIARPREESAPSHDETERSCRPQWLDLVGSTVTTLPASDGEPPTED